MAYVLVIGTAAGEQSAVVQSAGTLVGATLIAVTLVRQRPDDVLDRAAVIALVAFCLVCVTSTDTRRSLEAATTALAWMAAFLLARDFLRNPAARSSAVLALGLAGTVVAVASCLAWLAVWSGWLSAFDWRVAPPLDLSLPSGQFGYRHHVAAFVVLCAPATTWTARHLAGPPRVLAMLGLAASAFVLAAAGSRMLWFAAATAAILALMKAGHGGWGRLPSFHSAHVRVAVGAAILCGALGVLLFGGSLADRLTRVAPVDTRTQIWGGAMQRAAERPFTGWGPGSFPYILRGTDYFVDSEFAPRHPDSVPVQTVTEGGVVLSAAVLLAAVTAAWHAARRQSTARATFAMTFFGLYSLTGTPTEFGFLVAPLLVWIAHDLPREPSPPVDAERRRWLRAVSLPVAAVVAAAFVVITGASLLHDRAVANAREGALQDAAADLTISVHLDPAQALYARDLGWVELARDRPVAAAQSFARASELNPLDAAAARGSAIALERVGRYHEALQAAQRAAELQRSDIRNLLLLAATASRAGDADTSVTAVVEALRQRPLLVGSDGWDQLGTTRPQDLLPDAAEAAVRRFGAAPDPPPSLRLAWLAAFTHDPSLLGPALESAGPYRDDAQLLAGFTRCSLAPAALGAIPIPVRPSYWSLRVVLGSALRLPEDDVLALALFQQPLLVRRATGQQIATVIENDGGLDVAQYRRRPITLSDPLWSLPSMNSAIYNFWQGSVPTEVASAISCP